MAGMKGNGRFQQERSTEEYDTAAARAINLGHGGTIQVAQETGIPIDTLRKHVSRYKREQGPGPITIQTPALPDTNPIGHMADRAIDALWVELNRLTDPQAIAATGKVDVKRIGEIGQALKMWDGLGKANPATKTKRTALSNLTNNESGSLAA